MIRPSRTRHGPGSRGLALCLIIAQFILFTAGELSHRHELGGGPSTVAAAPSGGHASAGDHLRLQAPSSSDHRAPAECPICKIAQSTAAVTTAIHLSAHVTTVCGQAPIYSSIFPPTLTLGPSSARAPPTL
jgi:Protein of unknown function (DUF2946)